MNLLLFQTPEEKAFPVIEFVPIRLGRETGEPASWWGRLKKKSYHAYELFRERFEYQERVCAQLRHADSLKVIHSDELSPETAARLFEEYLDERHRKHFRWMWIDIVLAALGSLLTPIPGPNVFFLYPAARAFGHHLARKGIQKIRSPRMISFAAEPLVGAVQRRLNDLESVREPILQLEERYGVRHLAHILGGT